MSAWYQRDQQPRKMQILQNNYQCSYSRLGDQGGNENERKRLFEERKLARARAHMLTMETKQRMRALEQKQTEWDMKQKGMRENALLQRRQRIQNATECYQRAHLPPSQRYQQDFKRNLPTIQGAALKKIQGTLTSAKEQRYVLSSNTRRSAPSTKLPPICKSSHHQAASAVKPSTKLLQEQSMASFKNCQQTEDHSPQDSHLSVSESLSFKDSLEYEDSKPSPDNLQSYYSSFLPGLEKPHPDLELSKQKTLCPTSDITTISPMVGHGDNLFQSRNLHEPKWKRQEDSKWPNNKMHTSKASWGFSCVEQMLQEKELNASNNLNKVLNLELKTENPIPSQHHACLSNSQADTVRRPEKDLQKLPVSVGTPHSICQVRFMKGILKRQSQYMSGDNMCVYHSGCLAFPEEVALAIRDSVELTKEKTKWLESNSAVQKKLRWFDGEHVEEEDKKQDMKNKSSHLYQSSKNPEDHQESLATVSCASKPGHNITPSACTCNHFTKHATADVGVQVNLPLEQADKVKVTCSSNRTGGLKVSQRECSARAGVGPVSFQARRGPLVPSLSSVQMIQMASNHGKSIAPHPHTNKELVVEKTTNIIKNKLRVAVEREQAVRKPSVQQSIQHPGSGYRRFPQLPQPTRLTSEPVFSSVYSRAFPHEDLKSTAQLHLPKIHAEDLLEERDVLAVMKTRSTQRPGKVRQHGRQECFTTISVEEQSLFQSLERLNHLLGL